MNENEINPETLRVLANWLAMSQTYSFDIQVGLFYNYVMEATRQAYNAGFLQGQIAASVPCAN